jgi:hypothetical protein
MGMIGRTDGGKVRTVGKDQPVLTIPDRPVAPRDAKISARLMVSLVEMTRLEKPESQRSASLSLWPCQPGLLGNQEEGNLLYESIPAAKASNSARRSREAGSSVETCRIGRSRALPLR